MCASDFCDSSTPDRTGKVVALEDDRYIRNLEHHLPSVRNQQEFPRFSFFMINTCFRKSHCTSERLVSGFQELGLEEEGKIAHVITFNNVILLSFVLCFLHTRLHMFNTTISLGAQLVSSFVQIRLQASAKTMATAHVDTQRLSADDFLFAS